MTAVPVGRNRMNERLRADEPAFGNLVRVGDIATARKMGDSDFDFALLDMEHEGMDMPRFGDTLQWLMSRRRMVETGSPYPAPTPLVRLPHTASESAPWITTQALDYGALGIFLPYVETAEQVERMISTMRYPRRDDAGDLVGTRRVWPKGAMRYWGVGDFDEYRMLADLWPDTPTGEMVFIAIVATPEGFRNIDEITAVPGLTGALFGAKHLWTAMGQWGPMDLEHPDLVECRTRLLKGCQRSGIFPGASASPVPPVGARRAVDTSFIGRRVEEGFRIFLTQGDGRPAL